jgi:hypothetical protein
MLRVEDDASLLAPVLKAMAKAFGGFPRNDQDEDLLKLVLRTAFQECGNRSP